MNLKKSFWITSVFIFFVFIVSIILLNLLNALAISDTQIIIQEGEIADLTMKIKVLHKYERLNKKDNTKISKWMRKKMKIFDDTKTGKIVIDLNENKKYAHIESKEEKYLEHLRDSHTKMKPTKLYSMDAAIVKNLQEIVNEVRETRMKENKEEEYNRRLKNMEKLLVEVFEKLNS